MEQGMREGILDEPAAPALAGVNLLDRDIFCDERYLEYFRHLRAQEPVYLQPANDSTGAFWSITRYQDIAQVDTNHHIFSSEGSIVFEDFYKAFPVKMFIAMDPPKHTQCRAPVLPLFSSHNMEAMEKLIRERCCAILDALPRGAVFNWVDLVARELTGQMLATLLGIPQEDRYKLLRWSDLVTANGFDTIDGEAARQKEFMECLSYFMGLLKRRPAPDAAPDLITSLFNGETTRNMPPSELLGNLLLLIIAGNDTTRNTISGGVHALNQNPAQYQLLRDNPEVIPNMVSEMIRWQTPLAYMRRTALVDTRIGGKLIRAGDKVLIWYISANRDEEAFDAPEEFRIDRLNARKHLSFGLGIHRCVGARFAESQLRILWEEIQQRFERIEVIGQPEMLRSSFVKGYNTLNVILHEK
jgi:cytochrome P450